MVIITIMEEQDITRMEAIRTPDIREGGNFSISPRILQTKEV